jgi:hypothetical protein
MQAYGTMLFERLLVATATLMCVAGFWSLYFGPGSGATAYHHLHVVTNFLWLALLLVQIALIRRGQSRHHRQVGLLVLLAAPLLVASTMLLSVESARKALATGRDDVMIVQNVMGTLELASLIVLAFFLRRQRRLHGALLTSTALLFLGIAIFFTLIAWVPGYRIEGPDTFYRFGKALTTVQYACLAIGIAFFVKDRKHNWPYLLVGGSTLFNELVKSVLTHYALIDPLTVFIGSIGQGLAFVGAFCVMGLLLAASGTLKSPRIAQERSHVPSCDVVAASVSPSAVQIVRRASKGGRSHFPGKPLIKPVVPAKAANTCL